MNSKKIYDVLSVSKYAVNHCSEINQPVTNLELQKYLFFLQKYFLQEEKRPLFKEDLVAWTYGPVSVDTYYKFSKFGRGVIMSADYEASGIAEEDEEKIKNVIDKLKNFPAWKLVDDSHIPGGAWSKTMQGEVISKEKIRSEDVGSKIYSKICGEN